MRRTENDHRLTNHSSGWLTAPADLNRSPLRFAPGGTRQLSSKLLVPPSLRYGENQEFETDALRALLNCHVVYKGELDERCTTDLLRGNPRSRN